MHHSIIVWCVCYNLQQECCPAYSSPCTESTAVLCICITRATVRHDGSQTCITYAMLVLCSHSTNRLACRTVVTAPHDSQTKRKSTPSSDSCMHSPACSPYLRSCADSAVQLQGYTAAGQTEYALDSLRWIADYFVQNHHADLAFTGQIGNVGDDHSSWGRPEDMTEDRPGFDLTPTAPGDFCTHTLVTLLCAS